MFHVAASIWRGFCWRELPALSEFRSRANTNLPACYECVLCGVKQRGFHCVWHVDVVLEHSIRKLNEQFKINVFTKKKHNHILLLWFHAKVGWFCFHLAASCFVLFLKLNGMFFLSMWKTGLWQSPVYSFALPVLYVVLLEWRRAVLVANHLWHFYFRVQLAMIWLPHLPSQ